MYLITTASYTHLKFKYLYWHPHQTMGKSTSQLFFSHLIALEIQLSKLIFDNFLHVQFSFLPILYILPLTLPTPIPSWDCPVTSPSPPHSRFFLSIISVYMCMCLHLYVYQIQPDESISLHVRADHLRLDSLSGDYYHHLAANNCLWFFI